MRQVVYVRAEAAQIGEGEANPNVPVSENIVEASFDLIHLH
jgi:hypothetical protein